MTDNLGETKPYKSFYSMGEFLVIKWAVKYAIEKELLRGGLASVIRLPRPLSGKPVEDCIGHQRDRILAL